MDEDGEIEIPYDGKLLEKAYVGSHVENYMQKKSVSVQDHID